jgi:hypothetical protein
MKRHRLDPISFAAGALFLVVALAFLDGSRSVVDLAPTWLWGLPVLGLGVTAILVGVGRWSDRANGRGAAGSGDEGPPPREGPTEA